MMNYIHLGILLGTFFFPACAGTKTATNPNAISDEVSASAEKISAENDSEKIDIEKSKTEISSSSEMEKSSSSSVVGFDSAEKIPEPKKSQPMDSSKTQNISTEKLPEENENVRVQNVADIYVEIPRLAQEALSRADSFYVAGNLDSAAVIVEKFSVLNPLWNEWQHQAQSLSEKIQTNRTAKASELERTFIDLVNANARRADYADVKIITDAIAESSPNDSLKNFADSLLQLAYARTFQKVKSERDSALALAKEKANFDFAEQKISELIRRYPDYIDTLNLQNAILKIAAMRQENASVSADYWKTHDPQKILAEAKKFAQNKKWNEAKSAYQKLKTSNLRGDALRGIEEIENAYCQEKRQKATQLFAESRNKKSNAQEKLQKAIAELDACLEFAPDFKDRKTVFENKNFLQAEIK